MTMCVNVKKGLDDDADCAIASEAMEKRESKRKGLNVCVEI